MGDVDRIVERILARARIPGVARRREIERELRDHLEDLAEVGLERFGNPDAIGDALARVYAPARLLAHVARSGTLTIASSLAAAVIITSVQVVLTIGTSASLGATLRHVSSETAGIVAVASGYCAAYLARRQLRLSTPGAVGLILAVALWLATGLSVFAPRHTPIATAAFLSTAFGGLLTFAPVPLLWLAGTAAPLLIAGIALGPLLPGAGAFPWLLWVALSLSCGAFQLVAYALERLAFGEVA